MMQVIVLPNGERAEIREDDLWYHWRGGMKIPVNIESVEEECIEINSLTHNSESKFTNAEFVQLVSDGDLLPIGDGVREIRETAKHKLEG